MGENHGSHSDGLKRISCFCTYALSPQQPITAVSLTDETILQAERVREASARRFWTHLELTAVHRPDVYEPESDKQTPLGIKQ